MPGHAAVSCQGTIEWTAGMSHKESQDEHTAVGCPSHGRDAGVLRRWGIDRTGATPTSAASKLSLGLEDQQQEVHHAIQPAIH
jgi:hypothetical protein